MSLIAIGTNGDKLRMSFPVNELSKSAIITSKIRIKIIDKIEFNSSKRKEHCLFLLHTVHPSANV